MHIPKRWSRLTKKDGLLLCEELWLHCAKDGTTDAKRTWSRWKENGGDMPDESDCHCPCCEYDSQRAEANKPDQDVCHYCPIPAKAWTKNTAADEPCMASDSPFELWHRAKDDKTRKKYAHRIAKLARIELDKMEKK